MIEEAAGTRLYESKKEAAQKTIEKKDMKLREIDSVMRLIVLLFLARSASYPLQFVIGPRCSKLRRLID